MTHFSDFIQSILSHGNDGRAFEVFVKWFLKNDPEWSTQVKDIWLWDEWPDKWGPDCGIDLVSQHKNGEIWAVQAKAYAQSTPVTKKDMDSFLSESNRPIIQNRLLMASTDLMSGNARRTCSQQEKPVVRFMLHDFENAEIDYPAHISDLNKAKPKQKPELRKHQQVAIDHVEAGFKNNDRGQMIMACGTGKTFTTLWVKERLKSQSTLVLLPSLSLLSQTLREWTAAAQTPFDVLCVCSDQTVGRKSLDEAEDLSVSDFAFPVTSDVEAIGGFLKGSGPKVVFSTYQSSELVEQAQTDGDIPQFDLVVADEAHRCAGNIDGAFSVVLDGERIRASKRLFTTATPRTYTTHLTKNAADRGIEIVGMDDPVVFGPELHRLTFGQAIHNDPPLLTDYQVVIIGVDRPMIAQWIEEGELVALNPDMATDARSLAAKIGLIKAIKAYDLQRVISFHSRVKGAREFSEELEDLVGFVQAEHRPDGAIWSDFVSGEMSAGDRATKIKKLRALGGHDRGLLTNARCLSEGVDVPALDGVAFIDPRGSQIDIIQAVGRAIRLSDTKEVGTIVLPVFIEDGDGPEAQIEASAFKPVWAVLKALRSHDEVLALELDQMRASMGRRSEARVKNKPEKIVFDLPRSVDASFSEALATVLVEWTTNSWDFWFGLAQAFVDREGHARVPTAFITPEGHRLGGWVNDQRNWKDKMSSDRRTRLEALPGWIWHLHDWQWEESFEKLTVFVAREGHARVPRSYVTSEDYALGGWVTKQRSKRDELSSERQAQLEALDGWTWDLKDWKWEAGFKHLCDFVAGEGHARVPYTYVTPDGYRLGVWVNSQRTSKGELTQERRVKLEALDGWVWDLRNWSWEEGFKHLSDYVFRVGDAKVPSSYLTAEAFRLGSWVNTQRTTKDELTLERRASLEGLRGWVWNTNDAQWEEGFQVLSDYVSREGHARVPVSFITHEGFDLGGWCRRQRKSMDRMAPERKARLDALDGWAWDPRDWQWEEGYNILSEYVVREGHARVPLKYVNSDGYKLGVWVGTQRSKYHKISPERSARLEALPGWAWNPHDLQWEEGFRNLSDFVVRENHAKVPGTFVTKEDFNLGTWVARQRKNKDTMTPDRQKRLEALPGWCWSLK